MSEPLNDFILLDAAVWADHPKLEDVLQQPGAIALYGDLSDPAAPRCGPWLLSTTDFARHIAPDILAKYPWRNGISRLLTAASQGEVVAHLMSQRSIGMEAGDSYWLRFADTRTLAMLDRILSPDQIRQLKGPVAHWLYSGHDGTNQHFGKEIPAVPGPQPMIVLSETQSDLLLQLQLAGILAADIHDADNPYQPLFDAAQRQHVEASTAFALQHGIDALHIQRHLALVTLQTNGGLLQHAPFLHEAASLRGQNRWDELLRWQHTPKENSK